jgi:hydrogenase nickel incorporation protein HypB
MCGTCGCGDGEVRFDGAVPTEHDHEHGHEQHGHGHGQHEHGAVIDVEQAVLAKNDRIAEQNRAWLAERAVLALNLMSSPGAGKTSLLCRTIADLGTDRAVAVIEGDQETRLDAERIRASGAEVVQINTGSGCHLDAAMLAHGLRRLNPPAGALVFVENVGNLVCPALFDLGEAAKVVVVSVTEGEDKPLKYPAMFAVADLVVVNKIDLLPYVDVTLDRLVAHCRAVNPGVAVLPTSVTTGAGLDAWLGWLLRHQLDTPAV